MATATLGPSGYTAALRAGGHELTADEPESKGGADAGPTPLGLLLASLAACTAITLRMYAERKGWALTGIRVDTRFAADDPAPDGRIERFLHLDGDLDDDQRARLAEIAERTPVSSIVAEGRQIFTTVR
jgi:putative redox protein